jgi:putative peptidoglycan lipid II flippase
VSNGRTRSSAFLVAAGIFLSRIAGLVRQKVFAFYFGSSLAADAFNAAFRIPNLLQNLFGEGVLSASFIPEYSRLLAHEERERANELAGAVAVGLALISSLVVLAGVLTAPYLVGLIAPGFTGERRALTVALTRILFPGAGLLVFSAWCLGILNSHRKFFVSYTAPVIWNVAMIASLIAFGTGRTQNDLAVALAWASVAGSALQFLVQLPFVLSLARGVRFNLRFGGESTQIVSRNFVPAFISRGVVQISAFIDAFIASWLPLGSVATLAYAQVLYTLPVSLFGMAVSAAELPVMSSAVGTPDEVSAYLRGRLTAGLERIAFFVIPSAAAFLLLGDMVSAALYEWGRFTRAETIWVWQALAGSTIGLLASTWGRLYSSTYYALRDTRTPLNYALIRVALTTALGFLFALGIPKWTGIDPHLGVLGLTSSAGIAGWIEFYLLRREMNRRIGETRIGNGAAARLWGSALLAAVIGWGAKLVLGTNSAWMALLVLMIYGVAYLAITAILRVPASLAIFRRFK